MRHIIPIILLLAFTFPGTLASERSNYSINYFSIENGLTQNDVTAITQDHTGFVWMSTNNGLNRFDGHRIVTFKHSLDSLRSSISSNLITSIVTDSANCLWIANKKKGIDCYNLQTNSFEHFTFYYNQGESAPLHNVSKIYYSPQNRIYVCAQNLLIVYNSQAKHFIIHELCSYLSEIKAQVLDVCSDASEQSIFIATSQGVFQYEEAKHNLIRHSTTPSNVVYFHSQSDILLYTTPKGLVKKQLKNGKEQVLLCNEKPLKEVTTLLIDSREYLWIGTKNGLYIEKNGEAVDTFDTAPDYHVLSLYEDCSKTIWVGKRTYGAACISLKPTKFRLYNQLDGRKFTPAAFAIYPENKDSIWIATKQGELHLIDREKNKLLGTVQFPTGNINAISPHFDENLLWLAGTQGLYLFDKRTRLISHISESTKNGFITSIYLEPDSTLWCASGNGLFAYKHNKMEKVYPLKNNTDGASNICRTIFVEKDTIWGGFASKGLVKIIRRKGEYQCFPNEYAGIKENDISFVRKNSHGNLLVGTWGGGVNILHNDHWEYLTEENGLADNIVFSIYEDSKNYLWISTYNGLSHFNTTTRFLTKYEMYDGLPSNEFAVGAHFLFNQDELFLGTVNGIISFFPSELESFAPEANIILTDMYLFDKKVEVNTPVSNGKIILKQPLYKTKDITLPHQMSSFSFDLTNFNYSSKVRPSVRYKLNGWDKQWNALPSNLTIKYTNVPPGNYQLNIYNLQKDGNWTEKTLLNICINPPFHATSWAFALYYTTLILIFIGLVVRFRQRNNLKRLLFEEKTQKKYQEQLFLTRMKFYTNVSHELRTPLTLILGMLERIRTEIDEQSPIAKQLYIAKRNAEKLHLLINDILDLRKIENRSMKVKKENRNIISFMQTLVSYFKEMADAKHIEIEFNHKSDVLICSFDVDKTEKIIYNLLSNAIKYTKNHIIVTLSIRNKGEESMIEITVKDNGQGITAEEQKKIFSRYYQTESSIKVDSTGIGLNLALEMAHLQNGDITVYSIPEEGSTFTFTLPIEIENVPTNIEALGNTNKPLVLLVDDSEDMLYYMSEILENEYIIYTAINGQQAIDIANKIIPDIVICDIMMPDISGIEVCQKLKSAPMTCHIAIILISARGAEQVRIDGLTLGADIYISKPFSEDYFKAQIKSLLVNRTLLKKQIRHELMQSEQKEPLYQDEILKKMVYFIEQNLTCEDYDLELLSKDMCMSRMSLYRKMKTCTDQSPGEFIRDYRLKKAAELLTHSEENVSDICFHTGFNDLKSFRIAFKKKYGMTPSDFKKSRKNDISLLD